MLHILTPDGYSKFTTITRQFSSNIVTLKFASGRKISATRDHRFFINDEEVYVNQLKVGDVIDPCERIIDITECEPQMVYDVMETDNHKFIANDIISHNCQFLGSSGTLINGATLKLLEATKPIIEHEGLRIFKQPVKGRIYANIIDTSEGKGLDYSAFSVVDVTETPYEQVASFRSNRITPYDYSSIAHTVSKNYNDAYILVELNCSAGAIVAEDLFWQHEYENILMTQSAGRAGKKISSGFGGGSTVDRGIYTSVAVKATGCTMLKLLVEQKQLILHDKFTIEEIKTFSKKGKSYEAEEGKHDDMVMGLVLFAWLTIQDYFKEIIEHSVGDDLKEMPNSEIDDYVSGLGIMMMNDGLMDEEYAY